MRNHHKDSAELLEIWHAEMIAELLHERRVSLPLLERHAIEVLERRRERFISEKRIARNVLAVDIPERELWIDAALLILQSAVDIIKARFVLADHDGRLVMVKNVQNAGGLTDEHGRWRAL